MTATQTIDPTYLPFTREQLRQHFTGSADRNLNAFEKSAARYRAFLQNHPDLTNIALKEARTPRQIEKDETFWTAACLKALYEHPQFKLQLTSLLCQLYGATPPLDGLATWNDCLTGDLHLYFEARLPSPQTYVTWLSAHLPERQLIPYIRDAAARNSRRPLARRAVSRRCPLREPTERIRPIYRSEGLVGHRHHCVIRQSAQPACTEHRSYAGAIHRWLSWSSHCAAATRALSSGPLDARGVRAQSENPTLRMAAAGLSREPRSAGP